VSDESGADDGAGATALAIAAVLHRRPQCSRVETFFTDSAVPEERPLGTGEAVVLKTLDDCSAGSSSPNRSGKRDEREPIVEVDDVSVFPFDDRGKIPSDRPIPNRAGSGRQRWKTGDVVALPGERHDVVPVRTEQVDLVLKDLILAAALLVVVVANDDPKSL